MSKRRGRPRKVQPVAVFETVDVDDTTCGICLAEFLDPQDLQLHFDQVHGIIEGMINCGFCAQKFSDSERLCVHIRNEHIKFLSVCKFCYRCFLKSNECAAHEKLHVSSVKGKHSCSNCEETFSYVKEVELHEVEKHQNGPGVLLHDLYPLLSSVLNIQVESFLKSLGTDTAYICQKCTYSNSDLDRYLNHLKMSNCTSAVCSRCYYVFQNRSMLRRHIKRSKICSNMTESDLFKDCTKCTQKVYYSVFPEHKIKCKAIKCQHCSLVLPSGVEFTEHYSQNHPQSVSIDSCKYCGKYFFGGGAMQKHIDRMHKPEEYLYKYKCDDCEVMYKHPRQLFAHFLRSHPDDKPFLCKICNKSFRVRRKFTIHIKIEHKSQGTVKFTDKFHVVFDEKTSTDDKKDENEENTDKTNELTNEILPADNDNENITSGVEDNSKTLLPTSPCATATGTADDAHHDAEIEGNKPKGTKKPQKRKHEEEPLVEFLETESDDEPLLKIAKKTKRLKKKQKKSLICDICNKKCYTILKYKQHVAMHKKNQSKSCIKCNASFRSVQDLKSHYAEAHATSALTETLKRLLEKRKKLDLAKKPFEKPENMSEKFRKTIKKVEFPESNVMATVTEINGASDYVSKFSQENEKRKDIKINTSITIRKEDSNTIKPPAIKIYKFQPPKPLPAKIKLAMPTKCNLKPTFNAHKATIRLIKNPVEKLNFNQADEYILPDTNTLTLYTDHNDHHEDSRIPEVAQEIMLAATDHVSTEVSKNQFTHKIIIPHTTNRADYENIRIGHLLPVAPYYRIVPVKDILQTSNPTEEKTQPQKTEVADEKIELPSGTRLVNVNPLAHLLKTEDIIVEKPKSKRIRTKPKKEVRKNYQHQVAKALLKLEKIAGVNKEKIKPKPKVGLQKYRLRDNYDLSNRRRGKKPKLPRKIQSDKSVDLNQESNINDTNDVEPNQMANDDQDPTEIEYLEDFEDIMEIPSTEQEKAELNTEANIPGLSLPEL